MTDTQRSFSLLPELTVLLAGWRWLLGAVAVAVVLGVVVSHPRFMPKEYKARASFVPPGLDNLQQFRDVKSRLGTANPYDLEQVVGLLLADSSTRYIQHSLGLFEHYGIEGRDRAAYKALDDRFAESVSLGVDNYSSVEVRVYDRSPELAARIANAYVMLADSLLEAMAKRKATMASLRRSFTDQTVRREVVLDSLAWIRKTLGLYDLNYTSDAGATLAARGVSTPAGALFYDRLRVYDSELEWIQEELLDKRKQLRQLSENLSAYPSLLPQAVFATVPHYPSRPSRSLVVIGFVVAAFAVAVVALLVRQRLRTQGA
ncbi:MAG: hypothetical protein SFY70_02540 [Bacteroidia bacterium]|nr:hypothetical protein [Bacteroidia bacterium]